MPENVANRERMEEDVEAPIDTIETADAVKEVSLAMAVGPKERLGCLGCSVKCIAVLLVLLGAFVYWNFLRTPGLKISKETTYITEPLTADGTRVDYFAALEEEFYPPQMKTDDNGYRMIVRALGYVVDDRPENQVEGAAEAASAQVYEKLGLDPAVEPTMSYRETSTFLREYCAAEGLDKEQSDELEAKVYRPWTLDEMPMMGPWLEENGPVIDLLGEAVRRPTYCFPLVRTDQESMLSASIDMGEVMRARSFTRMIQARAYYRIGIADIDGAIDDVITCEHLGHHLECQGTVVSRLVGLAIKGIAAAIGVAAIRESQPTEEQLQRLVDELDALPPRPDMERMWLGDRYCTLDTIQALAVGSESLAELFSVWQGIEEFKPVIAEYVSVDWNIVLRRVNSLYDDLNMVRVARPPTILSVGNLFIGERSRRVGDGIALLCMPTYQALREADRRTDCVGNLRRITLAMLIYERRHGRLPPAYTVDADGNPLQSWRVLLLPYLGEDELFGKLRLEEAWDSQHNRGFHDAAPAIYQCLSAELQAGQTTYSVVVGENTPFGGGEGKSLADFGMHLMLVVERKQPVCWMDPTSELTESAAFEGINLREGDADGMGSFHPGGINVGFRDSNVRFISETIDLSLLRGLLDGTTEEYRY